MRAASRQVVGHGSSHGIDLAPMLDFVINLLIFFIITAVFLSESGLSVNRPTGIADDKSETPTTIRLRANGDIEIDTLIVDIRAVRAHIERMRAQRPESGLVIIAEDGAATGTLVTVVDQAHLAGTHDVTFTTGTRVE
jgi:biopolymer transport protein ExbD